MNLRNCYLFYSNIFFGLFFVARVFERGATAICSLLVSSPTAFLRLENGSVLRLSLSFGELVMIPELFIGEKFEPWRLPWTR